MSFTTTLKASALTALLFFAATDAVSQTISYNLIVAGRVPATTYFRIAGGGGALDLRSSARDELIATLYELSNSPTGYTVHLSSWNGWNFAPSNPAIRQVVPYSLKYGSSGSEAPLDRRTDSVVLIASKDRTGSGGALKNLLISFDGADSASSSDFSDTLVFTLTVN